LLIATDVGRLVKISKKLTLSEKAGERLAVRKTAVSRRKRLRGGVKPRLQRLTLLDRLLLSMLILSHVLFVCIPIVFLSQ